MTDSSKPASRVASAKIAKDNDKKQLNDEILNRFIEIHSQTEKYEEMGIFEEFQQLEEEFESVAKSKKTAETNLKVLTEKSNKEKQDFENISKPDLQGFFKSQEAHNQAISKKQNEYEQSLTKLENAKKELESISLEFEDIYQRLENFKLANSKALELNDEQIEILYSISFEGDFGSDLERSLENEVKDLSFQRTQLAKGLNRWASARFLVLHSYNQIKHAEKKWIDLMQIELENPENLIIAAEVKNIEEAAMHNLITTKSYLKNIDFPYFTLNDLLKLQNISSTVFDDMLSVDKQNSSLEILKYLRKRVAYLKQWFDQIIKESLIEDYWQIRDVLDEKTNELKLERVRLLRKKIKEKTGKDVKINLIERNTNKKDDHINIDSLFNSPEIRGTPLDRPGSTFELPPPPSNDQIIGSVEEIKKQYFKQVDDWNKHLDANKKSAEEKLQKTLTQFKKPNKNEKK